MKQIDGQDLINVFNSKLGIIGLKYFITSYYHPSSFESGNPYQTAYNEGKRQVVINLIDIMRAADPRLTAKMLSDVEYMILEGRQGYRKNNPQDSPSATDEENDG